MSNNLGITITPATETKAQEVARLMGYEQQSIEQHAQLKAEALHAALGDIDRTATPFASDLEVSKAIADPRYASDAAYRRDVQSRLAAQPSAPSQLDRMAAAFRRSLDAVPQKGYTSRAAMARDMASAAYKSDPAFRAAVTEKMADTDLSSLR